MKNILNEATVKQQIEDGLNGMRPGQMMVAISKQLGQSSSKFLGKHLLKIIVNAVKNGKVKAEALGGAIKDFGKKNIEDTSNIDWEHVELDPASMKFKCVFEKDAKKKIDEFMKQYEADMKTVKTEIEEQDKKLRADAKKAKLGMSDEEVDENGVAVASVLDDKENKGKKGKELKKKIDSAIKKDEAIKQVLANANKIKKASAKVKVDPNLAKLSDEELVKKDKEIQKKVSKKSDATKANDKLRSKIKAAIQKGINKEYGKSVKTMLVSTKALKKTAAKNMKEGIVDKIEEPKAVCISVQCPKNAFKDVLKESIVDVTNGSKNKFVQKIIDYIKGKLNDSIGKDKLGSIYAFLKTDEGDNDLLYVFAGVKEDTLNESLLNEEFDAAAPTAAMLKIFAANEEAWEKFKDVSDSVKNGAASTALNTFAKAFPAVYKKLIGTGVASNSKKIILQNALIAMKKHGAGVFDDKIQDIIDGAAEQATDASTDVSGETTGVNAPAGFDALSDGKTIPAFQYDSLNGKINELNDIFADGKVDPDELERLTSMSNELNEYQEWMQQNANSDNPLIQQKIAMLQNLTDKYNEIIDSHTNEMENALAQADDARTGATEVTRATTKAAANSEEMQKAAGGWKQALGLDKMFTALGIARLAAKTTGIILNNGKGVVDALGAYAIKNKEDKNVIAQMNFILQNGKDSKSKFDDTKFSVRYDVGDNKWHATCLDNRKMKFPEEEVINKALDSEEGKKFKKYCLDKWKSILRPKDERRNVISYILQNFDKLGLDANKETKDFIGTIKKMNDNFDKIEQKFK